MADSAWSTTDFPRFLLDDKPSRSRCSVAVNVLDTFAASVDDVEVQLPPRSQCLVAYLAISGRAVTRRSLVGQLWPDCDSAKGFARLRNVLWKVNSIVSGLVSSADSTLELHEAVRVDLTEARNTAALLLAGDHLSPPPQSIRLLQYDVLADWDEEWLDIERRAFTVLRLRALERHARRSLELSRHFEAELACRAIISAEPYRESARLLLAEVLIDEGNAGLAFSELADFAHFLRSELGITPNREIQSVVESIRESV